MERVLRGVYRRVVPGYDATPATHPAERWRLDQVARAHALAPALPEGQFFSHRTAAVLWRLPVPMRESIDLDVSTLAPLRAPRRVGTHGHRFTPDQVTVESLRTIPVASAASVWAMLGLELTLPQLVALGDAVIHRPRFPGTQRLERSPLAEIDDLTRLVEAGRRHGVSALRRALPLLVTGSASPPETHLRLKVAEWGLPNPALDHDVYDSEGVLLGASEIAFPQYRVALEYEGDHHRVETRQWNRDIAKYEAYARAGWHPIRVTAALLYHRESPLRASLVSALRQRGWRPGT